MPERVLVELSIVDTFKGEQRETEIAKRFSQIKENRKQRAESQEGKKPTREDASRASTDGKVTPTGEPPQNHEKKQERNEKEEP